MHLLIVTLVRSMDGHVPDRVEFSVCGGPDIHLGGREDLRASGRLRHGGLHLLTSLPLSHPGGPGLKLTPSYSFSSFIATRQQ